MEERKRTICWDCEKACGDCSWTDYNEQKPVKGWTAIRNDLKHKDGTGVESYLVTDCPEFVRDAYNGGQQRIRRTAYAECV